MFKHPVLVPKKIKSSQKKNEGFDQFFMLKNDFENQNFEIFSKVVHNFGKSYDDNI